MPRYIQALELLAAEYEALPRKPIVLKIPPTDEPVTLRICVERGAIVIASGKAALRASNSNGKQPVAGEIKCPGCGRTDFGSLRALNGHIAYESGKRKISGVALANKRKARIKSRRKVAK